MSVSTAINLMSGMLCVLPEYGDALVRALALHEKCGGGKTGVFRLPKMGSPVSLLAGGGPKASVAMRSGASEKSPFAALYTRVPAGSPEMSGATKAVAVVDVWGPLGQTNADVYDEDYGRFGTSYEHVKEAMVAATLDPEVKGTLIRIDSPGGSAIGMEEISAGVFDVAQGDGGDNSAGSELRGLASDGGKPVVSFAAGYMASAALGLGVQARHVLSTPSAVVGSIGTIVNLWNVSKLLENWGIQVNAIKNPDHKDVGSPFRAMGDDDRRRMQSFVDRYAGQFRAAVARGRRVDAGQVDAWVQTMIFDGRQAAQAKLVDGVVNSVEQAIAFTAQVADGRRGRGSRG